MMILKKGSKVEVLNMNAVPAGSWFPAEIVSGNGRYYSVRYDRGIGDAGVVILERVPRKIIRPLPPPVECRGTWTPGDIVEMYDSGMWKPVQVLNVLGEDYFSVQLHGCLETFEVHSSNLRVRQAWKNDHWRVLGKGFNVETEWNWRRQDLNFCQQKMEGGTNGYPRKRKLCVSTFHDVKRVSAISQLCMQEYKHGTKKQRAVKRDSTWWKQAEDNCPLLPEKVVAISSPKNKLAGKCLVNSHSYRSGRSLMESDKRNPSAECCELSVCSSSGSNSMNSLYPYTHRHLDLDEMSDDANSCTESTTRRQNLTAVPEEDMSAEIHKLELHAYRSTLEALYASGPMSWEQEALITNLRFMLHISNDEHLIELKHLSSR